MKANSNNQQLVDEHVFLVGRPPLGEFIGFVSSLALEEQAADQRALADEWRKANDQIMRLENQEAGWADNPEILDLPSSFDSLREQVYRDPIYKRSFSIVPTSIGMVELDRLVVFQKHINLEYVRLLQNKLGQEPPNETIFCTCLPFDHPLPPIQNLMISNNAYVFVSPSTDLRVLEPVLFEQGQIINYQPSGPISGVVGIVVGFGSNFLNAIAAEGRLVLNNGSHRAFALRDLGIKTVPCIIQHVSRREELDVIGSKEIRQNKDFYLRAPRPPLLKDYFNPKLRKIFLVPRRNKQVKVSFGVEQINIPAT